MIRVIRWIPLLFAIFFCSPLVADDPAPPAATPSKLLRQPELPKLTPKQQLEVQNWVRELQRQRATNRSRAEKQLYRYGAAAVPYLLPVSRSRFDLSRIAALRVLLKSPRYEAVPAALAGLQAENRWVRKLSWQLIEKISGIRSSFPWEEKDLSGLRRKKARIWQSWHQQQERLRLQEQQRLRELEKKQDQSEESSESTAKAGR